MPQSTVSVQTPDSDYSDRLATLVEGKYCSRIAKREADLWGSEATAEASIRLGWTSPPSAMAHLVSEVSELREELTKQGVTRVVLCGMGGSSLAPEVMARAHGVALEILDSTHPDHVRSITSRDLSDTVVVVSSKSGTTVETATAKASFDSSFREQGIDPAERIIVVTDPGSPLHTESEEAGLRVFLSDPTVGGRFSALTAFGLVPATLAGVATSEILDQAQSMHERMADDTGENPAVVVAAALADPHRDIMQVVESEQLPGFGDWIEQLVAESTGKDGRGILPVVANRQGQDAQCSDVITVSADTTTDVTVQVSLGESFVLWEWVTALIGVLIGVNPFDQPDVESAKTAARALLEELPTRPEPVLTDDVELWVAGAGASVSGLGEVMPWLQGHLGSSGYLAVQVYGNRLGVTVDSLREELAASYQRPVTIGYGPRFLHSTGQLHKGGPSDGVFVQIEWPAADDLPIPSYPFSYQQLIDAQAWGDRSVLVERHRPVLTLRVRDEQGFRRVLSALRG